MKVAPRRAPCISSRKMKCTKHPPGKFDSKKMATIAPSACYILTYRAERSAPHAAQDHRLNNLLAVLAWLKRFPELAVVLVEQDRTPTLNVAELSPHLRGVNYQFAYNPGPFNKSWGLNVGARCANTDVIGFGDADVMCGDVIASLNACRERVLAVNCHQRVIDLTAPQSALVHAGNHDYLPDASEAIGRDAQQEHVVFCGGNFFIRRLALLELGLWDERFLGWGGEDDAMSFKLQRARASAMQFDSRPAIHLYHERAAPVVGGAPTHADYATNLRLLQRYRDYSDEELSRLYEIGRQVHGNPNKYRPLP